MQAFDDSFRKPDRFTVGIRLPSRTCPDKPLFEVMHTANNLGILGGEATRVREVCLLEFSYSRLVLGCHLGCVADFIVVERRNAAGQVFFPEGCQDFAPIPLPASTPTRPPQTSVFS